MAIAKFLDDLQMHDTICLNHSEIDFLASQIHKRIERFSNTGDVTLLKDAQKLCKDIQKYARFAKKQGQSMENRLKKVRCGIEKLGFIRNGGREML